MFVDKRRMSRREFLRLGGAGLAGAGLLLGGAGCGGGEGSGENAIGWQAIPSYSPQAPDQKRVDYLNQSISGWEESYGGFAINPLISSSDVTVAMARLLKQANEDRAPDIAQVDSYVFPRFYEYVYPLDGYLEDSGVTNDYFPFVESLILGDGDVIKGLQFTTDVRVLYHRKDLVPEPPASWDEVLEVGRDLKSEGLALTCSRPAGTRPPSQPPCGRTSGPRAESWSIWRATPSSVKGRTGRRCSVASSSSGSASPPA
jgi:multiple sugar transport system substrate-binding protein